MSDCESGKNSIYPHGKLSLTTRLLVLGSVKYRLITFPSSGPSSVDDETMHDGPIKTSYWPVVCSVARSSFSETFSQSESRRAECWLHLLMLSRSANSKVSRNQTKLNELRWKWRAC